MHNTDSANRTESELTRDALSGEPDPTHPNEAAREALGLPPKPATTTADVADTDRHYAYECLEEGGDHATRRAAVYATLALSYEVAALREMLDAFCDSAAQGMAAALGAAMSGAADRAGAGMPEA